MRGTLSRLYAHEQFMPGPLGALVNPFYFARKGLHQALAEFSHHLRGRVLDVGCGSKPYQSLFSVDHYVGLEIDTPSSRERGAADAFYDGTTFPFEDESFDCALASQVFEHVFNPQAFLKEVVRVLKPAGILLLTVPFVWDEHEQPWDYARYSSFGLNHLLEANGLEVLESRKTMADVRVIAQLVSAYLYKVNPFTAGKAQLAYRVVSAASTNLCGEALFRLLPVNADLYLDNVVVAEKV